MPFNSMKFCHPWHPCQQRVLYAVKQHLCDRRLHLVAAPGAGKTVLGLEVFRMLGKPAMVLSPTRMIRNQWIDRLEDFCETDTPRELPWVSRSFHQPGILTATTYQALLTRFPGECRDEEPEIQQIRKNPAEDDIHHFIAVLEQHHIRVLILDGVNQLRAEWWRALKTVCDNFPDMTLVTLTATPLYDVREPDRIEYEQLCGPVDEEISVPELVKAGILCPHQDFIRACDATVTEQKQIEDYDRQVLTVCQSLLNSREFEQIVCAHPWLHQTDIESDVVKSPDIAIALMSFLKARHCPDGQALMQVFALTSQDIPQLDRQLWQVLIDSVLFSDTFQHPQHLQPFVLQLQALLQDKGLLEKRVLSLESSSPATHFLSSSVAKIDACIDIHQLEYQQRGQDLRQAILTDYIRDEMLGSGQNNGEIKLGAWPVFEALASCSPVPDQLALLTERLTLLPSGLLPSLLMFIDPQQVRTELLADEQGYQGSRYVESCYVKVSAPPDQLSEAMTALFTSGKIKVLVSTSALLGQGWQVPVLNSLILASSAGSPVLTNLMRGRAMRFDPQNPHQVSAIWHLVALNTRSVSGFSDLLNLIRRFDSFTGLSEKDNSVESGFSRMDLNHLMLPSIAGQKISVSAHNRQTEARFRQLVQIESRWHHALAADSSDGRVMPAVTMVRKPEIRAHVLRHAFSWLTSQVFGPVLLALSYAYVFPPVWTYTMTFVVLIVAGVLLYKLPETVKTLRMLCRYLPADSALYQIGNALRDSLCQSGLIKTPMMQLKVRRARMPDGRFHLCLTGGTYYDASLFADCLAEIFAPVETPKFLLVCSGALSKCRDYYAVPRRFASGKETTQIFSRNWNKSVWPSELIDTESVEGRKVLLKARGQDVASVCREEV
ncbi:Type III restriction enzyme, res subunit [Vibrio aerogenes CECT 7868]|uniref:Type III restriction enzyme, res subunit n=1 Tax=Vibrio aerogenes CECT 7868 TaxID=1216006 RepID=A0A1M5ZI59_9VIBR|nr:DEAD/DEAH box helicase family protein [Vibrio aerogenes]SHI23814.1 Type III restriction enzyme, res subunit [Vibrio aerogenes CECT 7868]